MPSSSASATSPVVEACVERFDALLGSTKSDLRGARRELLSSGIARSTVDALYPADFETIAVSLGKQLKSKAGRAHLTRNVAGEADWNAQFDRIEAIEKSMPVEGAHSYVGQVKPMYERQAYTLHRIQVEQGVGVHILRKAVYPIMRDNYWKSSADSRVNCYTNGIYMAYWLTYHARFEPEAELRDEVLSWVVEKQLPPVGGQ